MNTKFLKNLNLKPILALSGIKIKIAGSQEELDKIGALRKEVFVERGYVVAEEVPDIWLDDYDEKAINIYAVKKGEVIGVVRLLSSKDFTNLPLKLYFNLAEEVPEPCLEVSKLAVKSQHRGGKRLVSLALMQEILRAARKNSVKDLVMFMPEWLGDSIRKIGIVLYNFSFNDLSEDNIKARHVMRNYFKQNILPYHFSSKK